VANKSGNIFDDDNVDSVLKVVVKYFFNRMYEPQVLVRIAVKTKGFYLTTVSYKLIQEFFPLTPKKYQSCYFPRDKKYLGTVPVNPKAQKETTGLCLTST
jgi:hypothetical protein